ncbi:hypothetical protein QBC32DRAFT_161622 [Pseudoneurospora amorphoporcata]|uniref:LOG family protein n=1 Tax=Pseudoneurospora amorphoporcata TaxID=241081 RepID=A0AAN6NUU0_9PEZI|nr:hypothetical protein QBC32DRAFT_161622 [Pseudoneurospora amorphoporcata]
MTNMSTNGVTSSTNADGSPKRAKICVYCGASAGNNPIYLEAARQLARVMAANNIGLVYGGGTVGLMGEIAKTLVSLSGPDSVHGIIPEALVRYERDPNYTSAHTNGTQKDGTAEDEEKAKQLAVPDENVFGLTTIVKDMHTRKLMMAQEVLAGGPGSGFIAMSGGYGTMEELFETVTWNQLGIHDKGIVLLNINGFYDGILQWIQNSIKEGFVNQANGKIMVEAKNPEDAIKALREYKVSEAVLKLKWSDE